jgi:probable rRNA maturation factor
VIEVEARAEPGAGAADLPALAAVVRAACARLGLERATVGLLVVGPDEMARVNGEHRARPEPTDVLAFPVDGPEARAGWPAEGPPPELGDIVICPQAAQDPLGTLAVHGLLHLLGYDHEVDDGEMLALQAELTAAPEESART